MKWVTRALRSIGKSARTRVRRASSGCSWPATLAQEAARAFGAAAEHFETVDALAQRVASDAHDGITVLVKGSRFMRMERVVAALTGAGRGRALMLLWLTELLAREVRAFNVFGYISLRAVLATMTALVISFLVGPRMIAWLTKMRIGQTVRDDGPQTHLIKAGTPTMGGALILVSIVITTLLWADLDNRFIWVVLLVTLGFGAVGWVDDWRKVVARNPKGLSARAKLVWQSVIAIVAAVYLAFSVSAPDNATFAQLLLAWAKTGFSTGCRRKPT